jgi:uncharacterized protein YprB with RNaseH-like and TPR domain
MLNHTFCHIRGISLATERALWQSGVTEWNDAPTCNTSPISPARWQLVLKGIAHSRDQLQAGLVSHFDAGLPRSERWRMIPHLGKTAFLDIETTGLDVDDHVTTIAVFDGARVKTYVHGQNLDQFGDDMRAFDSIVTFNGSCFDLPVLKRKLNLNFPQVHIDLRFVFSALGVKGGLKAIEKRFKVGRESLDGVDGYTAVLLWQRYTAERCSRALETLLAYNVEDVLSLAQLLAIAFNLNRANLPIKQYVPELAQPSATDNPHHADPAVLAATLAEQYGHYPTMM